MKFASILNESRELIQLATEKATESSSPTVYVSLYSIAVGISSFIDWFSDSLPKIAILAGIFGVLVLARLNHKTGKLRDIEMLLREQELAKAKWDAEQRSTQVESARVELENAKIEARVLREKLLHMGAEVRRDEDKKR